MSAGSGGCFTQSRRRARCSIPTTCRSSRKPAPGEKAAPAGPGIEQRYRLLGLMNTGDSRRALLAEGKRRFAIAEGGSLEGWRVARIEHNRVVLSSAAGEAVLSLQPAATPE